MSALCLTLLFTHVLVTTIYEYFTWSQRWQHGCPQLYHFQRLTYNYEYEFRDYVTIFIPQFSFRLTFQLL
jgi:hypothetical protein